MSNDTSPSAARALPHALQAEQSVLSSIFQDPQEYIALAVENKLTAKHFYHQPHSTIFTILVELFEAGEAIELVSFTQTLLDRSLLVSLGGPSKITEIYTFAPTHAHFTHHLDLVKDKHTLRSVISQCTSAISSAYDDQEEVATLLDNVEKNVLAIREANAKNDEKSIPAAVDKALENLKGFLQGKRESDGIPTGYPELDRMSGGLKPSEIFIVAARPSMGKTSYAMNLVEHTCLDQGIPTMVFSLEMSAQQLVERLLYARARFSKASITRGYKATTGDLQNIKKASEEISACPLHIDDTPSITINELRAKARRKKKESDLQLIAVDYLQLMRSNSPQAANSREREVAEISAGLKALAKELEIPIIVLAQLNRGPEGRDGGKPRMSDLRESGSIEQDADIIGLLYRDAYYADSGDPAQTENTDAQLVISKNRNGATGDVPLTFLKELMRFETRTWNPPTK